MATNKSANRLKDWTLVIMGATGLVLTPIVQGLGIEIVHRMPCPRDPDGSCAFMHDFGPSILVLHLSIAWGFISVLLIIIGIIILLTSRKK